MLVGVISDTHGYLDPAITECFAHVDHIVHAGDIGRYEILHQLQNLAPVTAVLGNNDSGLSCREFERVEWDGIHVLVQHIVDPSRLDARLRTRLHDAKPAVVIFGHTHQVYQQEHEGVLFLNPGYAGRQRFNLKRSVALLRLENRTWSVEVVPLAS